MSSVVALAIVFAGALGNFYWSDWRAGTSAVPTILATWVQVTPGADACAPTLGDNDGRNVPPPAIGQCRPKFSVRAVVNGADKCPSVAIYTEDTHTSVRMEKREGYSDKGLQGVTVCAAAAPSDTIRVEFNAIVTISVTEYWSTNRPQKIVLFGDTGCKSDQGCDNVNWPFAKIIRQATGEKPGLVVHLGDYIYQGTDNWVTWKKYFFDPAKSLLEAAPWILVRGNHERCSSDSYPRGFYLLFGDGPAMACNSTSELSKPYAIDLSKQLRLIVADSAAAYAREGVESPAFVSECGTRGQLILDPDEAKVCAAVMDVLRGVRHLVPPSLSARTSGGDTAIRQQVWLATHVPVFGFERHNGIDVIPSPTAMMLAAWRGVKISGIDLIVSGDRHLYQVVKTKSEPRQVSVGTGGVLLDDLPFLTPTILNEAEFVTLARKVVSPTWRVKADKTISRDAVRTAKSQPLFSQEGCSFVGFGFLVAEWQASSYKLPSFRPFPPDTGPKSCL